MISYCLEITENAAVIHKVDCRAYDLGTLIGMGCVARLGEFPSASQAMASIKLTHPDAVHCRDCCQEELMSLPQIRYPSRQASTTLSD